MSRALTILLLALSASASEPSAIKEFGGSMSSFKKAPARPSPCADSKSQKKGIGLALNEPSHHIGPDAMHCLGVGWYYTWSPNAYGDAPADVDFYPMLWIENEKDTEAEAGQVAALRSRPKKVFLFNEPDLPKDKTAAGARYGAPQGDEKSGVASFEIIYRDLPDAKFIAPKMARLPEPPEKAAKDNECTESPSVLDPDGKDKDYQKYLGGGESAGDPLHSRRCRDHLRSNNWISDFDRDVNGKIGKLPFTYAGMQWYGGPDVAGFERAVETAYKAFGLPIMVQEFAVMDTSFFNTANLSLDSPYRNAYRPDQVARFMRCVLPWLEQNDHVIGYAWYSASGESLVIRNRQGQVVSKSRFMTVEPSMLWDENKKPTELGWIYAKGGGELPGDNCPK